MAKKYCVTGGTGHIGFALCKALAEKDAAVRLLLRGPSSIMAGFRFETVFGDILDYQSLVSAFNGMDTVFHVAGLVDINGIDEPKVWDVNVTGTENVWRACKVCGVKRLVYVSSVDALPPLPKGETMTEISSFDPAAVTGTYAKTKAAATKFLLDHVGEEPEIVICHPSACIGPYDYKVSFAGVLVRYWLKRSIPFSLSFGGYNFVDVRDVAEGLIAAAEHGKDGSCYILSGAYVTVDAFLRLLAKLTNHRPPLLRFPYGMTVGLIPASEKYYDLMHKTPLFTGYTLRKLRDNGMFSHAKATQELGYRPRSVEESLRDMLTWLQAEKA
ncbi:MAG: NAD-dependent epimerase/dehydratase family protein [Oscillospiraceae bacterium]|jgi:dihydroflavonol-4-reductase|nr:NAD-dependent epimerase/dehydratase family protein [Oscillospiraceae bacterium]